jgi:hypothetical protein
MEMTDEEVAEEVTRRIRGEVDWDYFVKKWTTATMSSDDYEEWISENTKAWEGGWYES